MKGKKVEEEININGKMRNEMRSGRKRMRERIMEGRRWRKE